MAYLLRHPDGRSVAKPTATCDGKPSPAGTTSSRSAPGAARAPGSGARHISSKVPSNDRDMYLRAIDFSDIEELASDSDNDSFGLISSDAERRIFLYSRPVPDCPIHLMKAVAWMPCSPKAFLEYMDSSIRQLWDENLDVVKVVRHLDERLLGSGGSNTAAEPFAFRRGQRRVALTYLGVKSPVPFVQDRDFELLVSEEVRASDGTVFLKATSTPLGYLKAPDPQQPRYVRGLVLISGLIASPIVSVPEDRRAAVLEPTAQCTVRYVALVHPMGLVPPMIVNMVISKQLDALKKLQDFIRSNPLPIARRLAAERAAATGGCRSDSQERSANGIPPEPPVAAATNRSTTIKRPNAHPPSPLTKGIAMRARTWWQSRL